MAGKLVQTRYWKICQSVISRIKTRETSTPASGRCRQPLYRTLEVFDTKDLEQKEDQELLARKCMSLAMECIRAHIFVAIDCGEEQMKPAKQTVKEQKMEHQEGGMMLCSQS